MVQHDRGRIPGHSERRVCLLGEGVGQFVSRDMDLKAVSRAPCFGDHSFHSNVCNAPVLMLNILGWPSWIRYQVEEVTSEQGEYDV